MHRRRIERLDPSDRRVHELQRRQIPTASELRLTDSIQNREFIRHPTHLSLRSRVSFYQIPHAAENSRAVRGSVGWLGLILKKLANSFLALFDLLCGTGATVYTFLVNAEILTLEPLLKLTQNPHKKRLARSFRVGGRTAEPCSHEKQRKDDHPTTHRS